MQYSIRYLFIRNSPNSMTNHSGLSTVAKTKPNPKPETPSPAAPGIRTSIRLYLRLCGKHRYFSGCSDDFLGGSGTGIEGLGCQVLRPVEDKIGHE